MTEQTGDSTRPRPRFSDFVAEVGEFVESVLPPENVRQHFRASRVEFWKGVRAMVDLRIEHISKGGKQQKGAAVPVE